MSADRQNEPIVVSAQPEDDRNAASYRSIASGATAGLARISARGVAGNIQNDVRALIGCGAPFHVPVTPWSAIPWNPKRRCNVTDLPAACALRAHPFHERGTEVTAAPMR